MCTYFIGRLFISSDKSHKDPFECEDESASSIISDEQEHKEFIESSENIPMDDDDDVESLLFAFSIIPITFVSTNICLKKKK